jgi:hypothetical protein
LTIWVHERIGDALPLQARFETSMLGDTSVAIRSSTSTGSGRRQKTWGRDHKNPAAIVSLGYQRAAPPIAVLEGVRATIRRATPGAGALLHENDSNPG